MKYYRIRHSIDPKVIGRKYPQVEDVLISTTWDSPMFLQSFADKKAPPNVEVPAAKLYKSAKVTDLISASAVGLSLNLLVSQQLAEILRNAKTADMQFFDTGVLERNGIEHKYSIVHSYGSGGRVLDFEKSTIAYVKQLGLHDIVQASELSTKEEFEEEIVKFNSYIETTEVLEKFLSVENVMFVENSDIDFFGVRFVSGGTGYYVSERLKSEIEYYEFTGMVFIEPNAQYP